MHSLVSAQARTICCVACGCRRDVPLWRRRTALRGCDSWRYGCPGGNQAHYSAIRTDLRDIDLQRNVKHHLGSSLLGAQMCGSSVLKPAGMSLPKVHNYGAKPVVVISQYTTCLTIMEPHTPDIRLGQMRGAVSLPQSVPAVPPIYDKLLMAQLCDMQRGRSEEHVPAR